jgi:hypothetical protein
MNPFEMVVMIVAISAVASVARAKYGVVRKGRGRDREEVYVGTSADSSEASRMQDEIKMLKERIQVLERVITDTNSASNLDREIEKLR